MSAPAPPLTAEMVPLLEQAAATRYGRICFPYEARKIGPLLMRMQAAGFLFWQDAYTPIITDAGRKAVNGPSMAELLHAEMLPHTYEGLAHD